MKTLQELLKGYLHHHPMSKGVDLNHLLQEWPNLLGTYLARRIHPVRFERGVLICQVSSPALIQEFSFVQDQILTKLRTYSGGELIRSIRCVTQVASRQQNHQQLEDIQQAYQQRQKQYNTSTEASPQLQAWEEELIRRQAASIPDDKLREKTEQVIQSLLRRQKYLKSRKWSNCERCQTYYEPIYTRCPYCHLFVFEPEA